MNDLRAEEFLHKVHDAMATVQRALEAERNPVLLGETDHEYKDKFTVAQQSLRMSVIVLLRVLRELGLSDEALRECTEWSATSAVTLEMRATERCEFIKRTVREEEQERRHKHSILGVISSTSTTKVIHKIETWHWKVTLELAVVVYRGALAERALPLLESTSSCTVMSCTDEMPRPEHAPHPPRSVDVTWLFTHLDDEHAPDITIDRSSTSCRTPLRNDDAQQALRFFSDLRGWAQHVRKFLLVRETCEDSFQYDDLVPQRIFVPVLPLLVRSPEASGDDAADAAAPSTSGVSGLPPDCTAALLEEHTRSLREVVEVAATCTDGQLISVPLAICFVLCRHCVALCEQTCESLQYVEHLLHQQLLQAVGKQVTATEFEEYMRYHTRKVFAADAAPRRFSFAVRNADHDPEGEVRIEQSMGDGAPWTPIATFQRRLEGGRSLHFPISASATIELRGDRIVHGWMCQRFAGEVAPELQLVGRARQFSNFIVLIGTMAGANRFSPKHGMVISNKDRMVLPLLQDVIPSARAFADAIESLSPEQQRFAKAYRSMQLEGSIFTVCVIQVKPQLERVLRLPRDALIKEIRLTQDLLDLFMQYNVSSDLLSFTGDTATPVESKVAAVRANVDAIKAMIREEKERELRAVEQRLPKPRRPHKPPAIQPPPSQGIPVLRPANQVLKNQRSMLGMLMGAVAGLTELRSNTREMAMCLPEDGLDMQGMEAMETMDMCETMHPGHLSQKAPEREALAADVDMSDAVDEGAAAEDRLGDATADDGGAADPSAPDEPDAFEESSDAAKQEQGVGAEGEDVCAIPSSLDAQLLKLDDGGVRPTNLKPGKTWSKSFQRSLLSAEEVAALDGEKQKDARNGAFDLLDAITKSGTIPIDEASTHVVVGATHCFDASLVETVIQRNVNPIEKVERSLLIMGSVVLKRPAPSLLQESERERVARFSPALFQ